MNLLESRRKHGSDGIKIPPLLILSDLMKIIAIRSSYLNLAPSPQQYFTHGDIDENAMIRAVAAQFFNDL
jgi:hypothetical protein